MAHWTDDLKHNKIHHLEEKDFQENPDTVKWRNLNKACVPIDMRNYEKVGGVTHNATVEQVINKMINDQEKARGMKIDQKEVKEQINMDGVKDNRKDRKFFKIYTGT